MAWGSQWSRTVFKRARDEDYTMQTRGRLLDRLRFMLAGRAAEALYLKASHSHLLLQSSAPADKFGPDIFVQLRGLQCLCLAPCCQDKARGI